ncbi:MAG TPA: 4-hydroxy-tetrahydrodipicolinate reductase [Longimicrobiales bacterium]
MSETRIVISGITGRMGAALLRALPDAAGLQLTGGIAGHDPGGLPCPVVTPDKAETVLRNADVVVDFSTPSAVSGLITENAAAFAGKGIVIGTTGLGAEHEKAIDAIARDAAVLTAANFSIGVTLLLDLVRRAARVLTDGYDIEIVEAHHRNKVDAPSGTALALARAAAASRSVELDEVRIDGRTGNTGKRPDGAIALHALRGGAVVGEHHVHFLGDAERIELAHVASDRILFAQGALHAARWIRGQAPGRYSMNDVLGL